MTSHMLLRTPSVLSHRCTILSRLSLATRTISVSSTVREPAKKSGKAGKKEKKEDKVVVKKGDLPPKRPGTAYLIFFTKNYTNEVRALKGVEKTEDRKKLLGDIATAAGNAWRQLPDQEKQVYSDEFAEKMKEYKTQMKEYFSRTEPTVIKEINRRRAKKGKWSVIDKENIEKRPTNAFIRFVMSEREKTNTSLTSTTENLEFVKATAAKWRDLSEAEKAPFVEAARKDFEEYKQKKDGTVA